MLTRHSPPIRCLVLAGVFLSAGAHAQVVRCTDAQTGKVSYTDGKCAGGTSAHEVEARKTPEEIRADRELAKEALERKQQRLRAEADVAESENRRAIDRARVERVPSASSADYARTPECVRSRRNLDEVGREARGDTYEQNLRLETAQRQVNFDCLGPAGFTEVEKARVAGSTPTPILVIPQRHPVLQQPPPPPPKKFVQCNVFRCHDGQGNSYPR